MATARGHTRAESVRGVMSSPRPKPNTKLLDAMIEAATVDAYNDEEKITGLFTMLEGHLALAFDTEMLGITVTVTKIDLTAGNEIVGDLPPRRPQAGDPDPRPTAPRPAAGRRRMDRRLPPLAWLTRPTSRRAARSDAPAPARSQSVE
jgi:hypothetical protein